MLACLERADDQSAADSVVIADSNRIHLRIGQQRVVGIIEGFGNLLFGFCAGSVVRLPCAGHAHAFRALRLGVQSPDMSVPESGKGNIHSIPPYSCAPLS